MQDLTIDRSRAIEIVPGDYNGLKFCQGFLSEMGADIIEAIRYFGHRKKIFYVHFRDVKGEGARFSDRSIDDGNTDMKKAVMAYKEVGFNGTLIPDHVPKMIDDIPWGTGAEHTQSGT